MSTTDTQALVEELDEAAERITRYSNSPLDGLLNAAARKLEELAALALAQPAPQGWRTIESAPKDGTKVLIGCGGIQEGIPAYTHAYVVYRGWSKHLGGWQVEPNEEPTHWMPLPPPPALPLAGDAPLQGEGK